MNATKMMIVLIKKVAVPTKTFGTMIMTDGMAETITKITVAPIPMIGIVIPTDAMGGARTMTKTTAILREMIGMMVTQTDIMEQVVIIKRETKTPKGRQHLDLIQQRDER
jgi:hypothetical protein